MIGKLWTRKNSAPYERRDARISQRARQHLARMRKKERQRLHGRHPGTPRTTAGSESPTRRMLWIVPFVLSILGGIYLARPLEPLLLRWAPAQFGDLESIAIQGNAQLSFKDVALATGIARGQSLAQIDLDQVETRLREEPWIKNAHVLRLPPATLAIRVEEREPRAVLVELTDSDRPRRMRLVDEAGVVFASASGHEALPHLIDGKGDGERTQSGSAGQWPLPAQTTPRGRDRDHRGPQSTPGSSIARSRVFPGMDLPRKGRGGSGEPALERADQAPRHFASKQRGACTARSARHEN